MVGGEVQAQRATARFCRSSRFSEHKSKSSFAKFCFKSRHQPKRPNCRRSKSCLSLSLPRIHTPNVWSNFRKGLLQATISPKNDKEKDIFNSSSNHWRAAPELTLWRMVTTEPNMTGGLRSVSSKRHSTAKTKHLISTHTAHYLMREINNVTETFPLLSKSEFSAVKSLQQSEPELSCINSCSSALLLFRLGFNGKEDI